VVTKSNRPTALSISVLPDAILGLAESQGHRDEVAAHLPVDGEQGGQRVLHRRRPVAICVPISTPTIWATAVTRDLLGRRGRKIDPTSDARGRHRSFAL
jgi:hypothetical protein